MTANVAYFVDGPLHGTHAELPRAEYVWNVARPADPEELRARPLQGVDLDVYITIQFGTYERNFEPSLHSPRVNVWRYIWKGWQ